MGNFFKYLTSGTLDKNWGLYLTVAGHYRSAPGAIYPSREHPTGYYFSWETGRTLQEYQLIYITEGSGLIETSGQSFPIIPGSIMIILPGVKHRYRPDPKTGWVEYFIGFKGTLSDHFISQWPGAQNQPVISCGLKMELINCYQKIFDLVQTQQPGYQQIASGMIIHLIGHLTSIEKKSNFEGKQVDDLVATARAFMWENVQNELDLKVFAKAQSVSYSYFRKTFKLYTGISPHQYYLDLKMMRAKELLLTSDKSIKEITYELGFDSIHYFSRLFKQKTGVSPSNHRIKKSIDIKSS